MTAPSRRGARAVVRDDGFTMIIALGVMFVTSLLLIAAFAVAHGDIHLSREDTTQKKAYYAALAGVQAYEARLQANPDYWESCEALSGIVSEQSAESYEVKLLPAESAPEGTKECSSANPRATVIESKGPLVNTFRIRSTGRVKIPEAKGEYKASASREVVATFRVTGFLNYVYYTNYEQGEPHLFGTNEAECNQKYYSEWSGKSSCQTIYFRKNDSVNGPMHTNDAAAVEGEASFGRSGHNPADAVEINGGTYPTSGCGEGVSAKYYTATKCYSKGVTLLPPESDESLGAYVESANRFKGVTHLELKGSAKPPSIGVTRIKEESSGELKEVSETIGWPANGLIYVEGLGKNCTYELTTTNGDSSTEPEEEKGCGNVYVKGSYSKSLTVGGQNEVIINGNVYPTSVEGSLGSEPTGTATLGLIASKYVRVYHPYSGRCEGGSNGAGSLKEPYIYAALLSTAHSFLVDNWQCGEPLGTLHEYGAIAQNYRGAVGTGSGESVSTGYLKDYKYDERLATSEPPFFLAPLKAGWSIVRQTAPNPG